MKYPFIHPPKYLTAYRKKKVEDYATSKGGKLLDDGRLCEGNRVNMLCGKGHTWQPAVTNLTKKKPTWCNNPECFNAAVSVGKRQGKTPEAEVKALLKKWSLTWIDGEYRTSRAKTIRATCSHDWHQPVYVNLDSLRLRKSSPCRPCDDHAFMEKLRSHAQKLGGKLLTQVKLRTTKMYYKWQCGDCREIWDATWDAVQSGSWCPDCGGSKPRELAEFKAEADEVVFSNGGLLIDVEEVRSSKGKRNIKVTYQCAWGHTQKKQDFYHLLKGGWCASCRKEGIGELVSRATLEHLTGLPFPKARPDFLRGEYKRGLELDGFNNLSRIAFEFQGQQHYERVARYQPKKGDFERQQERDRFKRKKCISEGVRLIEVPYWIALDELDGYLRQELAELAPEIPLRDDILDWRALNLSAEGRRAAELERMRLIAESKGGLLLSKVYVNNQSPLQFSCRVPTHKEFPMKPAVLVLGSWCGACGNRESAIKNGLSDDEIAVRCAAIEARLVGRVFTEDEKLQYKIAFKRCGHTHDYTSGQLGRGKLCNQCPRRHYGAVQRGNLDEAQMIAEERGGACLSRFYIRSGRPLLWQCQKGHIWPQNMNAVKGHKNKKGSWCRECSGLAPWDGTVEDFLEAEREEAIRLGIAEGE